MTYYHETRKDAEAKAAQFSEHFHTKAELEPYNGWVIVLVPKSADVLKWPLADLLDHAEIEFPTRLSKHRREKVRPPKIEKDKPARKAPPPPPPPPPPPSGATVAAPKPVAPPPPPPKPPVPAT